MKRYFLISILFLSLLFFLWSTSLADRHLVRGASPGEFYVNGDGGVYPYWDGFWLYRVTDYGQTTEVQNQSVGLTSFGEGFVEGELYMRDGSWLAYSDSFGIEFSQMGRIGDAVCCIAAGYAPGEIYAVTNGGDSIRYSSDYGINWTTKGSGPCSYGDTWCLSVGYHPGELFCGCSDGNIFFSCDYGNTFELIIEMGNSPIYSITRGSEEGEIYFTYDEYQLYYSPNYGDTVYYQYLFYVIGWLVDITHGFAPGEVIAFEDVCEWPWFDLFVHRSTDYGQTFTPYHVWSNHPDHKPPLAISDLTCATADTSIFLEWSHIICDIADFTEEVEYYIVYRNQNPDFVPSPADSIGYSTTSSYIDPDVSVPAPEYYYIVKAVDDSGNKSDDSNRVGMFNRQLINGE